MSKRYVYAFFVFILLLIVPLYTVHAAPIATVTLDIPDTATIGEPFEFTATFDNTHPTDVGYGPFIDLIMPFNGADGAAGTDTPDGVDFISANYLGGAVGSQSFTFPADGCVNHPFLRDEDLNRVEVCGTPGDKLIVLELPFGSYVPAQPPAEITVNAQMSALADLGVPLTIRARGGFRFGETAVDDPCCDPSIVGTFDSAPVTPTIMTGTKTISAPEDEVASGPNNPQTWTITLDIADGQTITDLDVVDYLPNTVVVDAASVVTTPANGTVVTAPPAGVPNNPPDNQLVVNFPTVTGTTAEDDISVSFDFYVPYADANGNPILDPTTGDDIIIENRFSAVGDWNPNDPRDGGGQDNAAVNGQCPTVCPGGNAPTVMSIAGQKEGITVPQGEPIRAGTLLEFTIGFQISDYFVFDEVVITDVLADGLEFDAGFTPVLSLTGPMTNFTQTPGANGSTVLEFRVTDELGEALRGGCVPAGGTGGPPPDCDVFNNGATGASITYRATVRDQFVADFPSGDPSVDHGDELTNEMSITGQILDSGDAATPTGAGETDESDQTSTVERGVPQKSLYAVNGVPCGACEDVRLAAGDTITYRLVHEMPSSDYEDFVLVDYLPLPVFNALEVTNFSTALDDTVPPAGTAKLLVPGDTLHTITGSFPTVVPEEASNSVSFIYGTFDTPTNQQSFIDLLFTVTMRSDPIADGLQLTNQVQAQEASTNSGASQENAIAQVEVTSPLLRLSKGVVATSNPNGQFVPAVPSPLPFNPPGTDPPFEGIINSDGLAGQSIDSDLTGAEQGDVIRFAIVIENVGTSRNGAFDIRIRDILPEGFAIPEGGINLQVRLGTGDTIQFSGSESDFFAGGIELIDPGLGVCGPFDGQAGTNIIIITYALRLDAPPQEVLTNTATVTNYSSEEGGTDHTGDQDLRDRASVGVGDIDITTETGGGDGSGDGTDTGLRKMVDNPFALPGEIVTWTVTATNNGGTAISNARIVDTVPDGVEITDVSASAGEVSSQGPVYTITIGLLPPGESVTITITGRIRDDLATPYVLTNTARLFDGETLLNTAEADIVSAATMPETGESPYSALRNLLIALSLISAYGLAVIVAVFKR